MSSDRKTIGLTVAGRATIDQLMETEYFQDKIVAAKFALAVAIKKGVEPGRAEGTETVWNIGSLDSDGVIQRLLPTLFDDVEFPYVAAESFINEGLSIIQAQMERDGSFVMENILGVDK